MPQGFTHQFTVALREAITEAIPDTPSGSHRMLVIGQLVVNIQQPALPPPPEFEGPRKRRSTR